MNRQKNNTKVVYFKDEINDDFAGTDFKNQKNIDENYRYIHKNVIWRIFSFVLYRMIAMPVVSIFCWVKYWTRIKNRRVLKPYKKKGGYFMYGNHTLMAGDAFHPNMINAHKRTYILINPDGVSIKGIRTIVEMLGGMPVASTIAGIRNMRLALEHRVLKEKQVVAIYPEAHIWPWCTKIRNFRSNSFRYPVDMNVPVFCFTTVFKKRKLFKTPRVEIYVDGPFFAPDNLNLKERERFLRDAVYEKMVERSKLSNFSYIEYVKVEE